jgi:SAM-dependent methyltransferase
MLGIREKLCYEIARRMLKPPPERNLDMDQYDDWRKSELIGQWSLFSDDDIRNKEVMDFGCGPGWLAFHLVPLGPKRIVGVEIDVRSLEIANEIQKSDPRFAHLSFVRGTSNRLEFPDQSFDTILAFDCVEHIMEPEEIFAEWRRILRPGGRVLIWWMPYRSPYGPHMEAMVPIPWAHVIFGQRAMLKAAARIYDSDAFKPMSWHLDQDGNKKPNKWKTWASFKEQGYINELTQRRFRAIMKSVGLDVTRFDAKTFSGSFLRRAIGGTLVRVPVIGEFMTSYYVVECART